MSNDSKLNTDVLTELKWEPSVDAALIGVIATSGVVFSSGLSGTVHSWQDWDAAESTAWTAPGVTNVENNIAIN